MTVVSNTSPITNLAAVDQLNLLQQFYIRIIFPQAFYPEMAGLRYIVPGTVEVQTLSWIQTQEVLTSSPPWQPGLKVGIPLIADGVFCLYGW